MTRQTFIQSTKSDLRKQLVQGLVLFVLIGLFGFATIQLDQYWAWHGGPNNPKSPELWIVLGVTIAWTVVVFVVWKKTDDKRLKCPHCQKRLGGVAVQVVVGSGRCGFCGQQIIDEAVKELALKETRRI